jgi:Calcineurin-like phosphoesterase
MGMKLQLLSDLHLETETFQAEPAPGAEALILAGDIDATWEGLAQFAGWPVPVLFVPGNHEYDGRDVDGAHAALRERCEQLGFTFLARAQTVLPDAQGRRIRFLGATRWSDFDAFGPEQRERCMRAGQYFVRVMRATRAGQPFDPAAIREWGLACREYLHTALRQPALGQWDATVVVTHFAPSLKSADPRYGRQPGTASFCNNDEALLPLAQAWLHGHLHCRHEYVLNGCRVVCHARGLVGKGEAVGHDPLRLIDV